MASEFCIPHQLRCETKEKISTVESKLPQITERPLKIRILRIVINAILERLIYSF